MKRKVLFIQRKPSDSVSIERVFDQIAQNLPADRFDIDIHKMPYGNRPLDMLKNLLFFPPKQADIYHITGQIHYIALRLPKTRTVLTIHDLIFLHRRTGLRRYILKKLFLDLPLRRVDFVTTISQTTKNEIVKYSNCDPAKIRVIENPLSEGFDPTPLKPFNDGCPVVLQIGTAANKNVPNLITALSGVNCTLRIIGSMDAKIKNALTATGLRYENVCGVGPQKMIEEYRNADIVAFCSTYEGFGLPIIEAQAMRKPVVTSNLSPMKDVAGSGAFLADPHDTGSIKDGVLKIINEPAYRMTLIENGSQNVLRFDPETAAAAYARLYDLLRVG